MNTNNSKKTTKKTTKNPGESSKRKQSKHLLYIHDEAYIYDQETFPHDNYQWYDYRPESPLTLSELLCSEKEFSDDTNPTYEPSTTSSEEEDVRKMVDDPEIDVEELRNLERQEEQEPPKLEVEGVECGEYPETSDDELQTARRRVKASNLKLLLLADRLSYTRQK